jgi:hypothetical protein
MDMDKELNCSEGARMLIERMQTHPKDFKVDGRFARITDSILGKLPVGFSGLSDRDDTALSAAYDKYILEPQLTEFVVDEIFNGEKRREEEQKAYAQTSSAYSQRLAQSMMGTKNQMATGLLVGSGFSDPRNTYGNAISNPAQGQVLWTEQEKPKAGRDWFEHEKQILKDMTKKTLAKLKRNKSK